MWVLALSLAVFGTTRKFMTFSIVGILNFDFRVEEGIYL